MKHILAALFFTMTLFTGDFADAQAPPDISDEKILASGPGGIKLLDGYQHVILQGIDSMPGKIQHKDGFKIFYEKGRIAPPGAPRLGGDFSNSALALKNSHKGNVEWYARQKISGQQLDVVLLKSGYLAATFPESGINFSAKTTNKSQIADFLVMIMTFPVKE